MESRFKYVLYVRNVLAIFLLLFVLWSLLSSCKKNADVTPTSPAGPGANAVWMQNNEFIPTSITVSPNSTVTWSNMDAMTHTVTSISGSELNSGNIPAGMSFSHTFAEAGSFPYHCTIHANMTGTVIVQ